MKLDLHISAAGMPARVVTIHPPRAMLGRAASCGVVIEHDTVSLEHAELRMQDGRWQLHQRSGRNATLVDGKLAAAEPVPLRDRGLLRLGEVTIEYQLSGEDQRAGSRSLAETARAPVPVQAVPVPLKDALARMEPIRAIEASEVHDLPTMILPRITAGPGSAGAPPSPSPSSGPGSAGYKPEAVPMTVVNPQRRSSGPNPLPPRAEQRQQPDFAMDPAPATVARIPRLAPESPRAGNMGAADLGPKFHAGASEAAPVTRMNLAPVSGSQARAAAPPLKEAAAPARAAPSRLEPYRVRPLDQTPDPLRPTPDPSAPERKRLEQQVMQLSAEVTRLHRENVTLKETQATLEAKLARAEAGSGPGVDGATPKKALTEHGLSLLEPFAASLKQATELLESREPERARKILREASFQLADLRDFFMGSG